MPYEVDEFGVAWYRSNHQRHKCKECICDKCGKVFFRCPQGVYGREKLYCSRACSNAVTGEKHKITRKGKGNPAWKDGRRKNANGYVRVYAPDHPYREKTHDSVFEHRLVMEKKIGRYLHPFETVHHLNGVRDDNRPENLELWTKMQPPGQRPEDLVKRAREILAIYGEEYPEEPDEGSKAATG